MCEFSSKLIPWLDRELPPAEAEVVDRHLAACRACREQADSFRNVSDAFALYIREASARPVRSNRRWLLIPAAIAAAVFITLFFRTPRPISNVHTNIPQQAVQAPAIPQNAPLLIAKAPRPRVHRRASKPAVPWTPAEPTIQVFIPADALFPPGALPVGVGFVADFRLSSEGSAGGLISRP